jgi:hypothetical protein
MNTNFFIDWINKLENNQYGCPEGKEKARFNDGKKQEATKHWQKAMYHKDNPFAMKYLIQGLKKIVIDRGDARKLYSRIIKEIEEDIGVDELYQKVTEYQCSRIKIDSDGSKHRCGSKLNLAKKRDYFGNCKVLGDAYICPLCGGLYCWACMKEVTIHICDLSCYNSGDYSLSYVCTTCLTEMNDLITIIPKLLTLGIQPRWSHVSEKIK